MHSACEKDLEGQEHKRCSGLNAFKTFLLHLITSVTVLRGGGLGVSYSHFPSQDSGSKLNLQVQKAET